MGSCVFHKGFLVVRLQQDPQAHARESRIMNNVHLKIKDNKCESCGVLKNPPLHVDLYITNIENCRLHVGILIPDLESN